MLYNNYETSNNLNRTKYWVHCTPYTVRRTLCTAYGVQYTPCTARCLSLVPLHYAAFTTRRTLHVVHYTSYITHRTVYKRYICTLYAVDYSVFYYMLYNSFDSTLYHKLNILNRWRKYVESMALNGIPSNLVYLYLFKLYFTIKYIHENE